MSEDWFDQIASEIGTSVDEDSMPVWEPKKGDVFKGEFVSAKQIPGKYDQPSYLVIAKNKEKDDEQTKIWCSRSVLRSQMLEVMPARGALLVVVFHGPQKAREEGKRDWFKYEVFAKESDPAYWMTVTSSRRTAEQLAEAQEERVAQREAKDFGPDESPF